jgi:3-methyladenine DNA glycosylase AlkD
VCAALADPQRATRYERYFSEGYDAWGVDHRNPEWIRRREAWARDYRDLGPEGLIEAGRLLVETGKYEHGAVAIFLASRLRAEYSPALLDQISSWFKAGIGNWAHTDVLCAEVLVWFLVDHIVDVDALVSWTKSPFKYQRRAVPVMFVSAIKAGLPVAPMLEAVRPLMTDTERPVQQAVGWFLREAWKCARAEAESFLLEYRGAAPRLIFQYATEKMTAEEKLRFRRPKTALAG